MKATRMTETRRGSSSMQGTIIKGVGGFYYVHDGIRRIYECRAKGIFRNRGIKPLVGDRVEFSVIDDKEGTGNVDEIMPRRSELVRPAAANVDQALLIFAMRSPDPNLNLLDRYLVMMARQNLPVILAFNKEDLAESGQEDALAEIYRGAGCLVLFLCAAENRGVDQVRGLLRGKTTVLAGPSGVGKSSLMNLLHPKAEMETGEISRKIRRGRNTTRHTEMFCLGEDTFLMDTPGFTSLEIFADDVRELEAGFPEFEPYRSGCRFPDCVHIGEKECGVKEAVRKGKIPKSRYDNYRQMAEEIRSRRKY